MKNHFKSTVKAVSKSEFAAMCNVHPSAVTRWIAEGKIGPEAIEGEGRLARIRAEIAMAQVRARSDIGQRLGNGSHVRLRPAAASKPDAACGEQAAPDAWPARLAYFGGVLSLAYDLPCTIALAAYAGGASRAEAERHYALACEGVRTEIGLLTFLYGSEAGVTAAELFDESRFLRVHWDAVEDERDREL